MTIAITLWVFGAMITWGIEQSYPANPNRKKTPFFPLKLIAAWPVCLGKVIGHVFYAFDIAMALAAGSDSESENNQFDHEGYNRPEPKDNTGKIFVDDLVCSSMADTPGMNDAIIQRALIFRADNHSRPEVKNNVGKIFIDDLVAFNMADTPGANDPIIKKAMNFNWR